jgi:hypothetical protein
LLYGTARLNGNSLGKEVCYPREGEINNRPRQGIRVEYPGLLFLLFYFYLQTDSGNSLVLPNQYLVWGVGCKSRRSASLWRVGNAGKISRPSGGGSAWTDYLNVSLRAGLGPDSLELGSGARAWHKPRRLFICYIFQSGTVYSLENFDSRVQSNGVSAMMPLNRFNEAEGFLLLQREGMFQKPPSSD